MSILHNSHTNQEAKIACAQSGCPDCLEALLIQHKKLIYAVVRRQYPGKCDYTDLIQEGWIGLWQAILHFDPGRGYAFSTYAWRAIRNQIWRAVAQGWKREGWPEAVRAGEGLTGIILAWQDEQVHQALAEALVCLPERLRRVIVLIYGLDGQPPMTLREVGRQMGLTAERIRQLRNAGLVLLRIPALSIRLRGLCEQDSRSAYRQARQMNNTWLRSRRGTK
jgi:RNA polymerase sigma factor (sigma-70 family)